MKPRSTVLILGGTSKAYELAERHKIILPSSHVVYEGLTEVRKDIQEHEKTSPVLSYGKSKDHNEKQIKNSGKNYIILRL